MSLYTWLFGESEIWEHVTVKDYAVSRRNGEDKGTIYVHFYESNKGNRKVKYESSWNDDNGTMTSDKLVHLDFYQKVIVRWLAGRYDPEIPKYNEVAEEDTANALRGKVE